MRQRCAVLRTVLLAALLIGLAPLLRSGASLAQDQRSQPAAMTPLVETEVRKAVEYVKHDGVSLTGDLFKDRL